MAFVEFGDADIAQIVIDEMDFYALGDKIIRVLPFRKSKIVKLFNRARDEALRALSNENLKVTKQKKMLAAFNDKKIKQAPHTEAAIKKATQSFKKNMKKTNSKVAKAGMNYKF